MTHSSDEMWCELLVTVLSPSLCCHLASGHLQFADFLLGLTGDAVPRDPTLKPREDLLF